MSEPGNEVAGQRLGEFTLVRAVRVRGCWAVYDAAAPDGTRSAIKGLCVDAEANEHAAMDNELVTLTVLGAHPGFPRLLATGVDEAERFSATTWCAGERVSEWADAFPNAPEGRRQAAVTWFARAAVPIAQALTRLHEAGIVHGDINGSNILLTEDMAVTLIDFESSERLAGPPAPQALKRRTTWIYAAPEFKAAGKATPRQSIMPTPATDQYSLAAALYHLLTTRHVHTTPDPRAAVEVRAPQWPGLPDVLLTAVNKQPGDRFLTMEAFTTALADAISPAGQPAPRPRTAPDRVREVVSETVRT